jgi:hypothetical protein
MKHREKLNVVQLGEKLDVINSIRILGTGEKKFSFFLVGMSA